MLLVSFCTSFFTFRGYVRTRTIVHALVPWFDMGSSRGGQREEDEATIHGQWRGVEPKRVGGGMEKGAADLMRVTAAG